MRATTGHPVRAFRGAGLLLALWLAYRLPAIRAGFEAAIAATGGPPPAPAAVPAPVAPGVEPPRTAAPPSPLPPPRRHRAPPARVAPARPAPPVVATMAAVPAAAFVAAAPIAGAPVPAAMPGPNAADAAVRAYASLAAGDRRSAVRLFDAALAGGDDPRSAAWRRQRDALTRRWSGTAYSIVRAGGAPGLAVAPVLGGGQSGAALAWTPDPLARRPVALTVRATTAHADQGRDAIAAVGVAWHPVPGVTVAAERLIAVGPAARGDWTARIAGGVARTGAVDAAAYAEAGVVGGAVYAAAQARVGVGRRQGALAFGPGVGAWASIQHGGGATVDRLDLGPGITARAGWLSVSADYRVRVAGNAAPGSGPVVTLSTAF